KKDYPTNCWTRASLSGKKSNILRKGSGVYSNTLVKKNILTQLVKNTYLQLDKKIIEKYLTRRASCWSRGVSGILDTVGQ
ncbi:1155_t:CDS:1, partial [Funneliformis caledonium]